MAKHDPKQPKQKNGQKSEAASVGMEVQHSFPHDLRITAANYVIVQLDRSDYRLSFFDVRPPILSGQTVEERREQLKAIPNVEARCIAEINISASRISDLVLSILENIQLNAPDQFDAAIKRITELQRQVSDKK